MQELNVPTNTATPDTDELTETVKFGGGCRTAFKNALEEYGQDELADRVADYGIMKPVPFTLAELRTLRAIYTDVRKHGEGRPSNSAMNTKLRINRAIDTLENAE